MTDQHDPYADRPYVPPARREQTDPSPAAQTPGDADRPDAPPAAAQSAPEQTSAEQRPEAAAD